MSKHLTLSDRAIIEKYLAQDMSFSYIAKRLDRSATTISREIKNHRCFVNGFRYTPSKAGCAEMGMAYDQGYEI